MKASEIKAGVFEGANGPRRVLAVEKVHVVPLGTIYEVVYVRPDNGAQRCLLATFARWAVREVDARKAKP